MYSPVAKIDNEIVGQISLLVDQNPRRKHQATFSMGIAEFFKIVDPITCFRLLFPACFYPLEDAQD